MGLIRKKGGILQVFPPLHYCVWPLLVLCALFFWIIFRGYTFGYGNQSAFLPSIYSLHDPSYLSSDWYVNSLLPYHYVFKRVYAFLLSFLSLEVSFFFSYIVAVFLYVIGCKKIVEVLCPSYAIEAFLLTLTALFLMDIPGVDASYVVPGNYYESSFLAMALSTLALGYFLQRKYEVAFFVLGINALIHIAISLNMFALLALSFFLLVEKRKTETYVMLARIVIIYGFLCIIPLLFSIFQSKITTLPNDFFMSYLRYRVPHHYYLSTFRGTIFEFIMVIVPLLCLRWICVDSQTKRIVKSFFIAICIGMCVQFFFTEILPVGYIAQIHFYRVTPFLSLITVIAVIAYFVRWCAMDDTRHALYFCLGYVCSGSPIVGSLFFWGYVISRKIRWFVYSPVLLICGLFVILAWSHEHNLYIYDKLDRFGISYMTLFIVSLVLGASCVGRFFVSRWPISLRQQIIICLVILGTVRILLNNPFSLINVTLQYRGEWGKMCQWIKENTAPTDYFIHLPYRQNFTLYTDRGHFVEFKASPWGSDAIEEWHRRMGRVTNTLDIFAIPQKGFHSLPVIKKRYNALTAEQIKDLAREYAVDYIIFEVGKELSFEIVYRNNRFVVYRI